MRSTVLLTLAVTLVLSSESQSLLVNLDDISLASLGELHSGNANADIDFLLEQVKSELPSSQKVPNLHDKYAYDCTLTGFGSGLYRVGDASLTVTETKAEFTLGLSTHKLNIRCRWRRKALFIKFSGRVSAYTNGVSARAKISLNLEPGAHPVLEEFTVLNINRIKTDVSGAGPLNFIGEQLLNWKANRARDDFKRKVEQQVPPKLQKKLDTFKLPSL